MSIGPSAATGLIADLSVEEQGHARSVFRALAQTLDLDVGPAFDRLAAGASLGEALDLPAGTAALLYDRAYRFIVAGRTDRAAPIFQVLTLIEPGDAKHWLGLGIAQARESATDVAGAALERACDLAPDWAVARFHLADFCVRSEHWTRAATELAVFDRLSKPDVPNQMLREAERLRLAIGVGLKRLEAGGAGTGGMGA